MAGLTLGVLGHVDHGKTALVKALTGTDTDRLAEEKRRGISIVPGYARAELAGGEVDLVDVPGHERFVRAMVAGAGGTGAALLVVAANEGTRAQTVEHLEVARLLGVRRGVVAVTKADLAPTETVRRVGAEAARLALTVGGWDEAPVVATAAPTGAGIPELREALDGLRRTAASAAGTGLFHLPVDRVFAVAGFGTVVTGTLRRGPLAVGEEVEVAPQGLRARVRGLKRHGRAVERAEPGCRVAVNLRGPKPAEIARGAVLAPPDLLPAASWLDTELHLLASAPRPLRTGERLTLLLGTAETAARLRLLDADELLPGGTALAQLRAEAALAAPPGERFVLRAGSPPRTLGGGRVLLAASARRRRGDPAALALLRVFAEGPPAAAVAASLRTAGRSGQVLADLVRLTARPPGEVRAWVKDCGELFGDGTALHAAAAAELRRRLVAALAAFHRDHPAEPGASRELLRRAAPPGMPPAAVGETIGRLIDRGEIVPEAGLLRLPAFRPPPPPAGREAELSREIESAFRRGGLSPPGWAELIGACATRRRALRQLLRAGVLVATLDRVQRREIVFHAEAVAEARRLLAAAFPPPASFLVGEATARLGTTRKYGVPLLEHLDARGFTRREGDRRRLAVVLPGEPSPEPRPAAEGSLHGA